jgi:hypothetical protein
MPSNHEGPLMQSLSLGDIMYKLSPSPTPTAHAPMPVLSSSVNTTSAMDPRSANLRAHAKVFDVASRSAQATAETAHPAFGSVNRPSQTDAPELQPSAVVNTTLTLDTDHPIPDDDDNYMVTDSEIEIMRTRLCEIGLLPSPSSSQLISSLEHTALEKELGNMVCFSAHCVYKMIVYITRS